MISRAWIGLIAVIAVLSYLTDGTFLTARNLTNLTRQVAINGILASGMSYVILLGGIDLSVGSVVALSGVIAGLLQVNLGLAQWTTGPWMVLGPLLTLAGAITTGLFCGIFNGWWITRFQIAPFVVTLGMMVIARGLALVLAGGAAIAPLGDSFNWIGQEYLGPLLSASLVATIGVLLAGLALRERAWIRATLVAALSGGSIWVLLSYRGFPIPVILFGVIVLAAHMVLERTKLGRYVLAAGGNPEAARLVGVPARSITFGIYALLGALAGLSGGVLAARLNGALPTAGELFELDAIAAVVIGGTSLLGGRGSILGTVVGAFFIGSLNNGMSLLDITEFYQKMIKGVIIIGAVWLDHRSQSRPQGE